MGIAITIFIQNGQRVHKNINVTPIGYAMIRKRIVIRLWVSRGRLWEEAVVRGVDNTRALFLEPEDFVFLRAAIH